MVAGFRSSVETACNCNCSSDNGGIKDRAAGCCEWIDCPAATASAAFRYMIDPLLLLFTLVWLQNWYPLLYTYRHARNVSLPVGSEILNE